MKAKAVSLALLFITITQTLAQLSGDLKPKFDEAERQIVRLQPTAFPELPGNLLRELQRRECTVPQVAGFKKIQNVIQGRFAKPGQTDWAVLCSVRGYSSILVFYNGSEHNPAELAKLPDKMFLNGEKRGAGEIGFARRISAVGTKTVAQHFRTDGTPLRPQIHHDGILDENIGGKPSIVHYYSSEKWIRSCPEPKIHIGPDDPNWRDFASNATSGNVRIRAPVFNTQL